MAIDLAAAQVDAWTRQGGSVPTGATTGESLVRTFSAQFRRYLGRIGVRSSVESRSGLSAAKSFMSRGSLCSVSDLRESCG